MARPFGLMQPAKKRKRFENISFEKKYMDSIAQEKKNRNTIDEGEAARLKILISLEMEIKTELKKKDCNWAQLRDFS